MTRLLLKKQLREIFRGWFFDARTATMRTKAKSILLIVIFLLFSVVYLGGIMTSAAIMLCAPLTEAGVGWLYFAILGLLATLLGVLVSGFSTFNSLYLARDNDLLLSLPIPLSDILASRLLGVYLMSLLYSAIVTLPAAAVYCVVTPFRVGTVLRMLLWILLISLLVLELSCLLGYVVARASKRLKNRSFITVLIALAFMAIYYVGYVRAMSRVRELIENPAFYAEQVRGAAYPIYLFGRVGEGDALAIGLLVLVLALLGAGVWTLVKRSFLGVVSAAKITPKQRVRAGRMQEKRPGAALLGRELRRFSGSANYMLNCGLGTVLLIAFGVAMLWKGPMLAEALGSVFRASRGFGPVLLCAAVCIISGMNDAATPSVALEGKTLWLVRSLPVDARQVLRAKLGLQLVVTTPGALFAGICAAAVTAPSVGAGVLMALLPVAFSLLTACIDLRLGLWHVNLEWTSEIVPIKQSFNVLIALFFGFLCALALIGAWLAVGNALGTELFLAAALALTLLAAWLVYALLMKRGRRLLESLQT